MENKNKLRSTKIHIENDPTVKEITAQQGYQKIPICNN